MLTMAQVYDLIMGTRSDEFTRQAPRVWRAGRAKYLMVVQSTVALALFGLIVARAVNAFT